MASVGISIPPPEPGTSPVSAHTAQQYDAFQCRNTTASGDAADRPTTAIPARFRKRSCSFHASDYNRVKRRRQGGIVPPTKFLLGGNICDPLNLGSLNDEEANRIANASTPICSPVPTPKYRKEPIEVIIPSDISDPLGLNGPPQHDLLSPSAQRRKRIRKKRKHPSGHGGLDRSVSVSTCERERAARASSEPAPGRSVSEGAELHSPGRLSPAPLTCHRRPGTGEQARHRQDELRLDFQPCPTVVSPRDATLELAQHDRVASPTYAATSAAGTSPVAGPLHSPVKPERPASVPLKSSVSSAAGGAPRPAATAAAPAPGPLAPPGRAPRPHGRKPSDEIVSPALPQPGARPQFPRAVVRGAAEPPQPPVFRPKDAAFQHGNYRGYYRYRNVDRVDVRLSWMKTEWFSGLDVLDVGCNVGHVTLTIARDHEPRRCVGIDIDSSLIKIAQRNVKRYQRSSDFPSSLALLYGDLMPPHSTAGTCFPRNVSFVHGNYVLESDAMLATVRRAEFDTILCLSVTKWIHLNYGDAGLRRFFRRAFLQLRPGGRLLLEPQPWASYLKKKKLTPRIWENFQTIRLRPDTFPDLLINEIGFERYQTIGRPHHSAKGFSRKLMLFIKAGEPESQGKTSEEFVHGTAANDGYLADTDAHLDVVMTTERNDGADNQQQSENDAEYQRGPTGGEAVETAALPEDATPAAAGAVEPDESLAVEDRAGDTP